MIRLSSQFTKFIRFYGCVPCLCPFLLAVLLAKVSIVGAILMSIIGCITVFCFWKYALPATDVFMDDEALYAGPTKIKIPFNKVTSVRQPEFLKYPPIIITYHADSGAPGQLLLIPSFEKFWGPFGQRNIQSIFEAINKKADGLSS